ncbi:sugar-binding transcriptional regulator [Microvirga thermotolerans]|uniref:Sugar-binding transcriptional regulator n=1 Tax=Microvirga thermotolerans TaxID=2651334 RepID=A0A5P9K3W8_9HYPH|nr:sugar-binding transcriptional regulator [Microvirga thermotolerans]QFU16994.1 sugar-binding transcriptional regulator [Microvirga thermotolerans]
MTRPDEQIEARVAWLYFMEGLTQAEIAERLGMTRLRVNRMLVEARTSGLVSIALNSRFASCVELERTLVGELGLKAAIVIPTPQDPDLIPVLIGQATGEYLSTYLEENRVRGLGLGWGATLRETIRNMRSGRYPDLCVNSMMGGLTHGLELNTFETASALANRLNAQCQYLAAPIYAGSPESRDIILAQDVFRETFERIAANDIAVLSIGDLSERSLLVRYGLPRDVSTEELRAKGAVGDIMGQFYDEWGKPIDHPLNRRAIALDLDDLARIPTVVLASGGANKTLAVAGALRARRASVLVCDEDTAREALALARGAAAA